MIVCNYRCTFAGLPTRRRMWSFMALSDASSQLLMHISTAQLQPWKSATRSPAGTRESYRWATTSVHCSSPQSSVIMLGKDIARAGLHLVEISLWLLMAHLVIQFTSSRIIHCGLVLPPHRSSALSLWSWGECPDADYRVWCPIRSHYNAKDSGDAEEENPLSTTR